MTVDTKVWLISMTRPPSETSVSLLADVIQVEPGIRGFQMGAVGGKNVWVCVLSAHINVWVCVLSAQINVWVCVLSAQINVWVCVLSAQINVWVCVLSAQINVWVCVLSAQINARNV